MSKSKSVISLSLRKKAGKTYLHCINLYNAEELELRSGFQDKDNTEQLISFLKNAVEDDIPRYYAYGGMVLTDKELKCLNTK